MFIDPNLFTEPFFLLAVLNNVSYQVEEVERLESFVNRLHLNLSPEQMEKNKKGQRVNENIFFKEKCRTQHQIDFVKRTVVAILEEVADDVQATLRNIQDSPDFQEFMIKKGIPEENFENWTLDESNSLISKTIGGFDFQKVVPFCNFMLSYDKLNEQLVQETRAFAKKGQIILSEINRSHYFVYVDKRNPLRYRKDGPVSILSPGARLSIDTYLREAKILLQHVISELTVLASAAHVQDEFSFLLEEYKKEYKKRYP